MDLAQYNEQILQQFAQFRATNEQYKLLESYLTSVDNQTYNIIGISAITILSVWFILETFVNKVDTSGKSQKKKGKKKKKTKKPHLSPLQEADAQIDEIMKQMEDEIIPDFEKFKTKVESGGFKEAAYKKNTKEDPEYMHLYYNELLLKKVMALDGIDTMNDDGLRLKRKQSIKTIQNYHRLNDALFKNRK